MGGGGGGGEDGGEEEAEGDEVLAEVGDFGGGFVELGVWEFVRWGEGRRRGKVGGRTWTRNSTATDDARREGMWMERASRLLMENDLVEEL